MHPPRGRLLHRGRLPWHHPATAVPRGRRQLVRGLQLHHVRLPGRAEHAARYMHFGSAARPTALLGLLHEQHLRCQRPPGSCNAAAATQMCNDVWFTYTPLDTGLLTVDVAYYWYDGLCGLRWQRLRALRDLVHPRAGEYASPRIDTLTLPASGRRVVLVPDRRLRRESRRWRDAGRVAARCAAGRRQLRCAGRFRRHQCVRPPRREPPRVEAAYAGCPAANGDINADGTAISATSTRSSCCWSSTPPGSPRIAS